MSKSWPPPRKIWRGIAFAVIVLVLSGLPVLTFFQWDNVGVIVGVACFYVAIAIGLRSRLIIGTVTGIGLALMFDSGVTSPDPLTRILQPVFQVIIGLIIGLIAGYLWDQSSAEVGLPDRTRRKKRP